jgi:hypothetical protein
MIRHRMRDWKAWSPSAPNKERARHRRRHCVLEGLEGRTLLSGSPTVFTVDLTSDNGTGSGTTGDPLYCITHANANTNTLGSEIQFDPTVFNSAAPKTITLANALVLDETAGREVIDGPGASVVTISGNNAVQVFSVSSDTQAALTGLTVSQGNTNQGGGGINNQGTLTVTSCTFSNNSTTATGGGIENDGTLTITNSTFETNSAEFGGGIENEGTLSVTGSTIESNAAAFGGGIDNDENGALTLTSTTVSSNTATSRGGGIFNSGVSPLTVTGGTFSNNSAQLGGGIFLEGDGADPPILTKVTDSTFTSNRATGATGSSGSGGGFYNEGGTVSMSGCTLSGNRATAAGGGIFANAGALTIIDSTLSGNSVTSSAGQGGGLCENGGTLNITNSTVAGNSAGNVGAGIDDIEGTLKAVNCTIADNTEPSTGSGLGGGLNVDQGTATLDNTIIALNTDGTGASAPPDNLFIDGSGTVSSASANNLIGAGGGNSGLTNGVNGNLVGVADPGLGTLANNGGPTQTIALLTGSPAINAGKVALAVDASGNPLSTDQRGAGFPRFAGSPTKPTVDIGAFEGTVAPAGPTDYTVDLTSDSGASTSAFAGDILYCVTQANANANSAGSVISFSPTVFAKSQTITLTSTLAPNELSGPEVINGPGANLVTLSGGDSVQVFDLPETATIMMTNMTIASGVAASGLGGAIANSGTLTVLNCTISGNSGEGAVFNSGTLTVTGSTLTNNTASIQARLQGGAIDNSGTLTVTDSTISGNSAFAGGGIENDGTATITGGTIANNTASVFGGGLDNSGTLTVSSATIQGNSVGVNGSGGGINNSGTLSVTSSTIANNSASNSGASVATGGGINSGGNMTTILDTTLSGNSAPKGGGVYIASGPVTVTNSTLAGNSGGFGGGIYMQTGTLEAVNCTIANNSVGGGGVGGGMDIANGTATLENTIVATNTTGTGPGAPENDIAGIVASASSFNMIGTGGSGGLTSSQGNLVGVASPDLGTLASNGGPTQTISLLTGSPAINAGEVSLAVDASGNPLPTDQRGSGFARTEGASPDETIDIGAFEVQNVVQNPVPTVSAILPSEIAVGYASPLTLTLSGSGFISSSIVDWQSTALATTYVSSSELTATIPASDFATKGSFPITVVNPAPGGGTSTAMTFEVLAAPSVVFVNTDYADLKPGALITIDGSTHEVGYDAFGTVEDGVTAVASGGTVDLAAQTYVGPVTITHSLTLAGTLNSDNEVDTTIQTPANFFASSDEVAIASGATVTLSDLFVEKNGGGGLTGPNSGTGIAVDGGSLIATDVPVFGFSTGVAVENDGGATITDSSIFDNGLGIVVDSSSSGISSVTANYDSLASNNVGVLNLQTSGSIDARFDWWGSVTGPTSSANPGGTGVAVSANVSFDPWLGDENLDPYDYLVFSITTGDAYSVTPISDNTELEVTTFGGTVVIGGHPITLQPLLLGTIPGGETDTLGFSGNGGTVTIDGELSADNDFLVKDTSVQFQTGDGLHGTTVAFNGTAITRNVDAEGAVNDFAIDGAGVSGPSGTLAGHSGQNLFFFDTKGNVLGNIEGAGSTTLDYSTDAEIGPLTNSDSLGVYVNLGLGTATGVSGSVSGITAIIGGPLNAILEAGTVPDVTLTGGPANNYLSGSGAGDSVLESISSSYTLTDGSLTGAGDGESFTDYLGGIKVANLDATNPNSNSFNVSGWTGTGSLNAVPGTVTVTASKNANFVLTDTSLITSDGMSMSLSGISTANLTGTGSGDVFVTSGWTQGGRLNGNNGIVEADESASITLTNTSLTSGTMALNLSGIKTAYLSVDSAAGQPRAIVNATGFSGVSNLVAAGAGNAILYSGSGADSSMSITGSGNDILIGNAPKMNLSGGGSGRSILIGAGSGGDTITGNGNDILVSGRTEFDSVNPPDNVAALDEILAEWTSSAPYLIRISKIKVGLGPFHRFAFRSNTIAADPKKNYLADGPLALNAGDWFLASFKDHVTKKVKEVKTVI